MSASDSFQVLYSPGLIHLARPTLCESDSFYFVSQFDILPLNYVKYSKETHLLADILWLANLFSTFHTRIKVSDSSDSSIASVVPLEVLRYKMLDDMSYAEISSLPSRYVDGYIVEGAVWSNGMYYLVREESKTGSEPLDIVLYIDPLVKATYNYP